MKTIQTENGTHTIIDQKGCYTLLAKYKKDGSFSEYVVCKYYDEESGTWSNGHYFWNKLEAALEYIRIQTDPNYISRARLEEIATIGLHAMLDDDIYGIYESDLDLEPNELEFFGIKKEEIIDDDFLIEDEIYAYEMEYERGGKAPWWLE